MNIARKPVSTRLPITPVLVGGILSVAYAALRLTVNVEFAGASWKAILDYTAERPVAYRLLTPLVANAIIAVTHVTPITAFGVVELISTLAVCYLLFSIFRLRMPERYAYLFAMLFLFVLPLLYLLRVRWPIFYPYDTPAIAFSLAGFLALLRRRWDHLLWVMLLGTLNRESIVIVPLIGVALYAGEPGGRRWVVPLAVATAVHVAARLGLLWLRRDIKTGPLLPFFIAAGHPRFLNNLCWLQQGAHLAVYLGFLGFLPLAWWVLWSYIPPEVRRVRFACALIVAVYCVMGNLYEPRENGDVVAIMYVPVIFGLFRWLQAEPAFPVPPCSSRGGRLLQLIDAWGVTCGLGAAVLCLVFWWLHGIDGLPDLEPYFAECRLPAHQPWLY